MIFYCDYDNSDYNTKSDCNPDWAEYPPPRPTDGVSQFQYDEDDCESGCEADIDFHFFFVLNGFNLI